MWLCEGGVNTDKCQSHKHWIKIKQKKTKTKTKTKNKKQNHSPWHITKTMQLHWFKGFTIGSAFPIGCSVFCSKFKGWLFHKTALKTIWQPTLWGKSSDSLLAKSIIFIEKNKKAKLHDFGVNLLICFENNPKTIKI